MSARPNPLLTPDQYLARERASDCKHEYYRGEVFAMAGPSRAHNLAAHNLAAELRAALKGRPCEVYQSDMRVLIEATGLYTYPDVVVVCGERRFRDSAEVDTLLNPTVLVEILSPSTSLYDRSRKFAHYRQLPSLRAYVLVEQDQPMIERYTVRDGVWSLTDCRGLESVLELEAIDCAIPLSEIYARIEFGPLPPVSFEPEPPGTHPGRPD